MNVKNNKRNMLLEKDINQISVTDICNKTGLNRSTFYANYIDIYDLADKLKENLEKDFNSQFTEKENQSPLTMFKHIYENQLFYKIYFKLGYDEKHKAYVYDHARAESDFSGKHIKYHIEFFKCGINAIIKMWLADGCKETPEEMVEILKAEYKGR